MKVAIIGAGVSGLSCALELERNGITPKIFEKRSQVGEISGFSGMWSKLVIRTRQDPMKYMKKKYDLELKPLSSLNEAIMISPNKKTVAKGNLGYTFRRGIEENSLEKQILSRVKSDITFNTYIELDSIRNDFDKIVVATSNSDIGKELNVWTDTFLAQARIAFVLGDFKLQSATIWFNEKYANKAFCYLIPNNLKEATLSLIINNISTKELDYYWKEFLEIEHIEYPIIEQSDVKYSSGFVNPFQVENIYFVGNAAGFTDNLIGIGAFNAIESGILAAQAIANNTDYSTLAKPIFEDIVKLHEFRKAMNTLDNSGLDNLIGLIGLPGVKQFIYSNALKLQYATPLIKLYNKSKGKSHAKS